MFTSLFHFRNQTRRQSFSPRALRFAPRLENLESRVVPSSGHHRRPFGEDGRVTTDFKGSGDDFGYGMAQQPDGKTLVAGPAGHQFGLARYNVDGSLDANFGVSGIVTTNFVEGADDAAWGVAIQSDGKILVAGTTEDSSTFISGAFAVARYNVDGSLDTSFGGDGKVVTRFDVGSLSYARTVAVQPDGRIVVGGFRWDFFADDQDLALVRYHADGSLDLSFGADGKVTTNLNNYEDLRSITLQGDGKILVTGETFSYFTGNGDFILARYETDGSPDAGFGVGGIVTTDFDDEDFANSVTVLPDGKIMAAGGASDFDTFSSDFAVARYHADGSPDLTFGVGGKFTSDFGGDDWAEGLAIYSDGSIAATGNTRPSFFDPGDFALVRFHADGSPDPNFGMGGTVTTDFGGDDGSWAGAVLQLDGKVILAGFAFDLLASSTYDFALARYNTDGSLDTSFDIDGKATTNFVGSVDDFARGLALQPDGKTVVVGRTTAVEDFLLLRYNADGSLDTRFGNGGSVFTDFGGPDSAYSVAIQSDGKIVVAGETFNFATFDSDFAVARYNRDGSLDTSFGVGGKVTTDFGGSEEARDLALLPDGKIVVAGSAFSTATFTSVFTVSRYNVNGTLDTSFDGDGKLVTDLGFDVFGASVAVRPDGRIVVAGTAFTDFVTFFDFVVVQYNSNGSLDSSFGAGGVVTTNVAADNDDFISDVALQPDGRIVVAGSTLNYFDFRYSFALARYNANGSLDARFGDGGIVTTDFITDPVFSNAEALGVAVQPNGKIVAVGYTIGFTSGNELVEGFAVSRYDADGSLDASFDDDGKVVTDLGYIDDANDVAIRKDGKIVVAGDFINPANGSVDIAVVRYKKDGSLDGDPLTAAAPGGKATHEVLSVAQVQPLLDEAVSRWYAAGFDTSGLANVQIIVSNLPDNVLGMAYGNTIWLDSNAAGWGWFVDSTPGDDSEFTKPGDQGELNRIDLLSALMHELGHILGHDHEEGGVMSETLACGERIALKPADAVDIDWSYLADKKDRARLAVDG